MGHPSQALCLEVFRNTPYWLQFVYVGQGFQVNYRSTISAQSSDYLQIVTPAFPDSNLIHSISTIITTENEQVEVNLIEDPTIDTDGTTEITPVNLDRRHTNTPSFTVYSDPSGISGGTVIDSSLIPEGSFISSGQTVEETRFERIFKPDTNYILEFSNEGTAENDISLSWILYESSN